MQEVVCTHLVRKSAGVAIFRKTPAAGGGKDKKRKDVSLFQSFFDLSQKKQRAAVLTTPLPPVATAAVVGFGATYGASS